jgi:hypothetical protein
MIKTKHGGYSWYKKMVKEPGQVKGRAMLRKAVDDSVKALNIMWDSWSKTGIDEMGGDQQSKYSFAAYYIFKYLAETKEFDSISELHGYIMYLLWKRENGNWVLLDNNLEGGGMKVAKFATAVGSFMQQAFAEHPKRNNDA